jgi:putative hydrolase of the HAD superfamily
MFALAADKLGMQAHQHTSFEATKEILETLKKENLK